jgi:putative oxidoreductase
MKRLSLILKILLGLVFVVFGLNYFLHFIPAPPMSGLPAQAMGVLAGSGWMTIVKVLEIALGAMLLANFYAPLALVLLAPITVNIAVFHALIHPEGLPMGIVLLIIHVILLFLHKSYYQGMLRAK